ncbi:hypothetical protein P5E67_00660 [Vibrio parahaemolyticus]|nr:hypothetical protein [Vibrio parahaemolyticus]
MKIRLQDEARTENKMGRLTSKRFLKILSLLISGNSSEADIQIDRDSIHYACTKYLAIVNDWDYTPDAVSASDIQVVERTVMLFTKRLKELNQRGELEDTLREIYLTIEQAKPIENLKMHLRIAA